MKKAMGLIDDGVKPPPKRAVEKKPLAMPPPLAAALEKNAKARATYDAFEGALLEIRNLPATLPREARPRSS